jgi:hypothetical protein
MIAVNTQPDAHETPPVTNDTSLTSLLGGIVSDVQKLLEDHLHLLRLEVVEDLNKSKNALLPLAVGGGLLLTAFLLLLVALIGWLAWLQPEIPWFGWVGIVAGSLGTLGLLLLWLAQNRWQRVNPLPEKTMLSVKKVFQRIRQQFNPEPLP